MRGDVEVLFKDASIHSAQQWNRLRLSFVYRDRYPCEVVVSPEGDRWVGQRAPIMRWYNGERWIDVMVPDLTMMVGHYPGTYGRDEDAKAAAMDLAQQALTVYLCDWIEYTLT
jgi:hypothetical protein